MFAYETATEPHVDYWQEYGKAEFIEEKLQEICKNIAEKGTKTCFTELFDYLYEHIEDNIELYLPEADYDFNE